MKKEAKRKGIENPKYAREMAELRRSGAAGVHEDKRTRRARSRSDAERKAIDNFKEEL